MPRRNFFKGTSLALLGISLFGNTFSQNRASQKDKWNGNRAKNIIFMASDGMSKSAGWLNRLDYKSKQIVY